MLRVDDGWHARLHQRHLPCRVLLFHDRSLDAHLRRRPFSASSLSLTTAIAITTPASVAPTAFATAAHAAPALTTSATSAAVSSSSVAAIAAAAFAASSLS